MARDKVPATSGSVDIANNIGASSTIFTWPVFDATGTSPEMHLTIRVRSDGQMFMAMDERWPDAPFQDQ